MGKVTRPAERPKRPRGRPPLYTEELAGMILERLAAGESLRSICEPDNMPANSTVVRWYVDDDPPGFAERYARARRAGAEINAEGAVEDTRTCSDPQKGRLVFDAWRWYVGKMHPARFGEKLSVDAKVGITLDQALAALADEEREGGG